MTNTNCMRALLLLLLAFLFASPAAAGGAMVFGTSESIHKIRNIELKGREGQDLYIGHKTTLRFFIGGIYVRDDGYVLGVSGDYGAYYELPPPEELREYQLAGLIPDPLPGYNIPFHEYLLGYSLWIILAITILFFIWAERRENKGTDGDKSRKKASPRTVEEASNGSDPVERDSLSPELGATDAQETPSATDLVRSTDRGKVESIYRSLKNASTEELANIWHENDRTQYTAEAFTAVERLLKERGGETPEQGPENHVERDPPRSAFVVGIGNFLIAVLYIARLGLLGALVYVILFEWENVTVASKALATAALGIQILISIVKTVRGPSIQSSGNSVSSSERISQEPES